MRRASIVLVVLLLISGCGTSSPQTPAPGGTPAALRHAPADVGFVRALIPHHEQGITLARAVATRPEARTLAEAIIVTQQDEVVRMTGWLTTWGEPAPPSAAPTPAAGQDDPIRALITHQEEAVKLAQAEQAGGTSPEALAFARQIIESRTSEAAELRTYLS